MCIRCHRQLARVRDGSNPDQSPIPLIVQNWFDARTVSVSADVHLGFGTLNFELLVDS